MTKLERDARWQEIFDRYDKAIGEAQATTATLQRPMTAALTALVNHVDEIAARVDRIAAAVHEANRAALALYRDEE